MIGIDPSLWNNIGNAVWIGLGGFLTAFIVYLLFSRLAKKSWVRFIGNLIALVIVVWTIKLLLDTTGAIGIMVIVGTALTGAIALGSETIASDFISGIKLFTSRPFNPGNLVSIAGQTGVVDTVGLTSTTLIGRGNQRIIVRNSDVVTGTIINFSSRHYQYVEIQVSLLASQDLDKAVAAILKELNESSPEITDDLYKPGVICGTIIKERMIMTVYSYVVLKELTLLDNEKTLLMLITLRALKENGILLSK